MVGKKDWADLWLESPELVQVKAEIEELKLEGLSHVEESAAHLQSECSSSAVSTLGAFLTFDPDATSFLVQLRVVSERTMMSFWRNPDYVSRTCPATSFN